MLDSHTGLCENNADMAVCHLRGAVTCHSCPVHFVRVWNEFMEQGMERGIERYDMSLTPYN